MANFEISAESSTNQANTFGGERSETTLPIKEANAVTTLLDQAGLANKIKVSAKLSKSLVPLVDLKGQVGEKGIVLDPAMVQVIIGGGNRATPVLYSALDNCFPTIVKGDASSRNLLETDEFQEATLSNVKDTGGVGNEVLIKVTGMAPGVLPCFYGSTSGLNFAELLETQVCASQSAVQLGQPVEVVFDHNDHESERSYDILSKSIAALPKTLRDEFAEFSSKLGGSLEERRLIAAQTLLQKPVHFVLGREIFQAMEGSFSLGKLALLGRLSGGDPTLFSRGSVEFKLKNLMRGDSFYGNDTSLQNDVSLVNEKVGGFTYYARDAVMAADFAGRVVTPLKMTMFANIYKVLGRYGALHGQSEDRGTILCPIIKHRIQTREMVAAKSGDPFDVTTLAFLAMKFPSGYQRLIDDFHQSCQVLTPSEAIARSYEREDGNSKDMINKRFTIEDYFPALNEGRRVSIV